MHDDERRCRIREAVDYWLRRRWPNAIRFTRQQFEEAADFVVPKYFQYEICETIAGDIQLVLTFELANG